MLRSGHNTGRDMSNVQCLHTLPELYSTCCIQNCNFIDKIHTILSVALDCKEEKIPFQTFSSKTVNFIFIYTSGFQDSDFFYL